MNGNVIILESYCFRCKTKREIVDPIQRITANKRKLLEGNCIECGGKIARMGPYAKLPDALYSGIKDNNDTKEQ